MYDQPHIFYSWIIGSYNIRRRVVRRVNDAFALLVYPNSICRLCCGCLLGPSGNTKHVVERTGGFGGLSADDLLT